MKYILITLLIIGITAPCIATDYDYKDGTYATEDEVAGTVTDTKTVAQMKAEYFALKAEKEYHQELVQNAIAQRDAAIAAGQAALDKITEINAKMAELRAAYEAWVEAANVPEPVE